MNVRSALIAITTLLCAISLGAVLYNTRTIALRKAELARAVSQSADTTAHPNKGGDLMPDPAPTTRPAVPSELLRLRAEVTRLNTRKTELTALAQRTPTTQPATGLPTNAVPLPLGYIRKANAQYVGQTTPDNTLQSMLWALHNQDLPRLLACFTDEIADNLRQQMERSGGAEEFLKNANRLTGLVIKEKSVMDATTVDALVEMIPGGPPNKMSLRLVNGEWKIANGG